MIRIDHLCTAEIVCPNCGEALGDSCEMEDEGELECDVCGCRFYYSRRVEVTYTTHAVKPDGEIDWLDEMEEKN